MSNTSQARGKGPMGGGQRMMPGEKAKDFKGTLKKLMSYMAKYKVRLIGVLLFAFGGTVFNIVGPKILGKATTELFNGLVAKIGGTGGIDFGKITSILLWALGLYVFSAVFSFIQGWIMTGISNDVTYSLRKEISGKLNRIPLKYFDDYLRDHADRRLCDDAEHQCVDDVGSPGNLALFHGNHRICHEAFPEIFQGPAKIFG